MPRGVRFINPSFIKNGSYTSSMVPASSPTAVAMVVIPTGPPLNLSIIQYKMRLSISSNPYSSIFSAFNACFVMSISIFPVPFTWAKSRTLRKSEFTIRGVPLLREAISFAASSEIYTSKIPAERFTIPVKISES